MTPNADVVEPMTDVGSAIVMTCWVETVAVGVGVGTGVDVGRVETGVGVGTGTPPPPPPPVVPEPPPPQAARTAAQPNAASTSAERCGDMRNTSGECASVTVGTRSETMVKAAPPVFHSFLRQRCAGR